jgi:hypothetical protein
MAAPDAARLGKVLLGSPGPVTLDMKRFGGQASPGSSWLGRSWSDTAVVARRGKVRLAGSWFGETRQVGLGVAGHASARYVIFEASPSGLGIVWAGPPPARPGRNGLFRMGGVVHGSAVVVSPVHRAARFIWAVQVRRGLFQPGSPGRNRTATLGGRG